MKYVEIYDVGKDFKQRLFGKVMFDGSKIIFKGLSKTWIRKTSEQGIMGSGLPRKLIFPKDGLRFLKALQFELSGSRIRASGVMEDA